MYIYATKMEKILTGWKRSQVWQQLTIWQRFSISYWVTVLRIDSPMSFSYHCCR